MSQFSDALNSFQTAIQKRLLKVGSNEQLVNFDEFFLTKDENELRKTVELNTPRGGQRSRPPSPRPTSPQQITPADAKVTEYKEIKTTGNAWS